MEINGCTMNSISCRSYILPKKTLNKSSFFLLWCIEGILKVSLPTSRPHLKPLQTPSKASFSLFRGLELQFVFASVEVAKWYIFILTLQYYKYID